MARVLTLDKKRSTRTVRRTGACDVRQLQGHCATTAYQFIHQVMTQPTTCSPSLFKRERHVDTASATHAGTHERVVIPHHTMPWYHTMVWYVPRGIAFCLLIYSVHQCINLFFVSSLLFILQPPRPAMERGHSPWRLVKQTKRQPDPHDPKGQVPKIVGKPTLPKIVDETNGLNSFNASISMRRHVRALCLPTLACASRPGGPMRGKNHLVRFNGMVET